MQRKIVLRFITSIFIIAAFLFFTTSCQMPERENHELSAEDVAGIKATLETWVQAGIAGDWSTFLDYFTEDAVWIFPDFPVVEGIAAIRNIDWVRAVEWELNPVHIEGRVDLAFTRGTFSLLLDVENAEKFHGNIVMILRKQLDGSWLIALYFQDYG